MRRVQRVAVAGALVGGLVIGAVRGRAYVLEGPGPWTTTPVRYYVNPANVYVTPSAAITAIQSAAGAWNAPGQANIQLAYAGTTSTSAATYDRTNNVFFRTDSTCSGCVAQTIWWAYSGGPIIDADTIIYQNYKQYTHVDGGCELLNDGYYVENTMTHEFGHALGLGHSTVSTATMWPSEAACETSKETLDPDDIAGIQYLYPPTSTTPTVPAAPTQLGVTVNGANPTTSLMLAWVDTATNASGYRVERSADGVSFALVTQLGGGATAYTDNGLTAGGTYYYRVYAYNSAGTSNYSNVAAGQTQSGSATASSAPSAPYNPSPADGATGVNTNVTLNWSDGGGQLYDVYVNGALYASNLTNGSVALSSLSPSTSYTWSVVAKNSIGSTAGPAWSFTTRTNRGRKK